MGRTLKTFKFGDVVVLNADGIPDASGVAHVIDDVRINNTNMYVDLNYQSLLGQSHLDRAKAIVGKARLGVKGTQVVADVELMRNGLRHVRSREMWLVPGGHVLETIAVGDIKIQKIRLNMLALTSRKPVDDRIESVNQQASISLRKPLRKKGGW